MSSDAPFGVTVWGWGTTQQTLRVSYAYPAGAGFKPINEIVVPPDSEVTRNLVGALWARLQRVCQEFAS